MNASKTTILLALGLCFHILLSTNAYSASVRDEYHADRIVVSIIFERVFFREWIGEPISYPAVGKCGPTVVETIRIDSSNMMTKLRNTNGSEGFCRLIEFRYRNRFRIFTIITPNFLQCKMLSEKVRPYQGGQADEGIYLKKETKDRLLTETNQISGRTYQHFIFSGHQLDQGKHIGLNSFKKYRPFKLIGEYEKNGACHFSIQLLDRMD